jgi:hypothetical protein
VLMQFSRDLYGVRYSFYSSVPWRGRNQKIA